MTTQFDCLRLINEFLAGNFGAEERGLPDDCCQDGLNVSRPKGGRSADQCKSPFKNNTFLDLSAQKLTEFRAIQYSHLSDIRYLYLKNNELRTLDPDTFQVFPKLVWLDLRNNELSTFPSTVVHGYNLTTVLLENNNLQELPVEIGSLRYLKNILLRGNPLLSPLREIVEIGPKKTSEHLKNRWYKHSGTQPPEPEDTVDGSRRNSLSNIRRKMSKTETQPSVDSSNFMWSEEIRQAMEQHERYVQKKRDVETLKEWRSKHSSMPKIGSKDPPPFGVDQRYLDIITGEDPRRSKPRSPAKKLSQKNKRNVDEDFIEIQRSLDEIRTTCFRVPENSSEIEKMKFVKGCEINKLRELQKKLEEMKMKY